VLLLKKSSAPLPEVAGYKKICSPNKKILIPD
jgi:hypothetical protein